MTRSYSQAELDAIWKRLNQRDRGVLSGHGDWSDASGLRLVNLGLARPTAIEMTRKGLAVLKRVAPAPDPEKDE